MNYNSDIHHRRSIRLKGFDYTRTGAYYITICTQNRECLFGEIVNGEMRLNEAGRIIDYTWNDLVNHIGGIELDCYVIMPNHFHGVVVIVGAGSEPAPTGTTTPTMNLEPVTPKNHGLFEIVRQFKTFSARRINELRQTPGIPVWQRNYYEHVIRNEDDYRRISEYIINNPIKWDIDENNPVSNKAE